MGQPSLEKLENEQGRSRTGKGGGRQDGAGREMDVEAITS